MSETGVQATAAPEAGASQHRQHGGRSTTSSHRPGPLRFAGHVFEMMVSMMVGMMVGMWLVGVVSGSTVKEAISDYPVLSLIAMAVSMTVPMVAWMRFRGHSLRNCVEMGASMILPALPFIPLFWLGVVAAPGRPYMSVSTVAMVALMVYRRKEYGL